MIYCSVAKLDVFATKKQTTPVCNDTKSEIKCCSSSYDEVNGVQSNIKTVCTTCDIGADGKVIGSSCIYTTSRKSGQSGAINPPGNVMLPPSNNTGTRGLTGNPPLGNALPPSSLPPSNAVPAPPTLPSTAQTKCPNGLPPDANGNCSTTSTNQQAAQDQIIILPQGIFIKRLINQHRQEDKKQ